MTDRITLLSSRFKHVAALGVLARIAFFSLAFSTREWTPVFDQTECLKAAYNLVRHG